MNETFDKIFNDRNALRKKYESSKSVKPLQSINDIPRYLSFAYVSDVAGNTDILFKLTGAYTHDDDCGFNAWGVSIWDGHISYINDNYYETSAYNVKVMIVDDEFWKFVEDELEKTGNTSELQAIKKYYWSLHLKKTCKFTRGIRKEVLSQKKLDIPHNIIIKNLVDMGGDVDDKLSSPEFRKMVEDKINKKMKSLKKYEQTE